MKLIKDIIKKNVKQTINEYFNSKYLTPLVNNFNKTKDDRIEYAVRKYYNYFINFLEEFDRNSTIQNRDPKGWDEISDRCSDEDETLADDILHGKYKKYLKSFYYFLVRDFLDDPYNAPSYISMNNIDKKVSNRWLIHFSNNARNIFENGFEYGINSVDKLAHSKGESMENKKGDGYVFAYDATVKNFIPPTNFNGLTKYGKHAVLFQASSASVYHMGDSETQYIFWGPTAKNIVLIERTWLKFKKDSKNKEGTYWCLMSKDYKVIYFNKDIDNVIKWVITNFEQYKNVISNYDPQNKNKNFETSYNR